MASKFLSLFIGLTVLLALAACSKSETGTSNDGGSAAPTQLKWDQGKWNQSNWQ